MNKTLIFAFMNTSGPVITPVLSYTAHQDGFYWVVHLTWVSDPASQTEIWVGIPPTTPQGTTAVGVTSVDTQSIVLYGQYPQFKVRSVRNGVHSPFSNIITAS